MARDLDREDDEFFWAMRSEVHKARKAFPHGTQNPTLVALAEEVGELSQAALHIREGKPTASFQKVYLEAVQVAVMAMRMATEGDEVLGVYPTNGD